MQDGVLILHFMEQTEVQYQIIRSYMYEKLQYLLVSTQDDQLLFVRKPTREERCRHFKHSSILSLPDGHFYIVLKQHIRNIQESDQLANSLGAVLQEKGVIA